LYSLAGRERLAGWVEDGAVTSTELTDAELVDATHALFQWGGVGLLVTGLLLVLGGVGWMLYRRRMCRRKTGADHLEEVTLALIGAAVTVITENRGESPVL
jgi:hypothetical protein